MRAAAAVLDSPGARLRLATRSIYGSANPALDFPRLVDWYVNGRLHLDELVSATYPLEHVNDALEGLDAGAAVRSVIIVE